MKKSLLALLFAVALAVPALAENMWIGGSLGYQNTSAKAVPGGDLDANSFTIAPEFGVSLDEAWDIGLDLSYTSGKNLVDSYDNMVPIVREACDTTTYGIAPFARYHVAKVAGVDVMIKGSLFYKSTTIKEFDGGDDVTINSYGIAIAPVISYSINERWSIGATLDFLSLGYSHSSSSDLKNAAGDEYSYDEFGFNVNNGSLISIGFSYHF
ncbi:MAG: outer membrane beta-barrel protein [Elusimicrobia bacterium]|nr:outer membrane beta-barrel protein [Elusimicrobiota bacterium]